MKKSRVLDYTSTSQSRSKTSNRFFFYKNNAISISEKSIISEIRVTSYVADDTKPQLYELLK